MKVHFGTKIGLRLKVHLSLSKIERLDHKHVDREKREMLMAEEGQRLIGYR